MVPPGQQMPQSWESAALALGAASWKAAAAAIAAAAAMRTRTSFTDTPGM
jgi:hypothetical protein